MDKKNQRNRAISLALTGGIACGKSEALKIFQLLGFHSLQADLLVKEIYQEKEIKSSFFERWGKSVFSKNSIDYSQLAKIIFSKKEELLWLEEQVYPRLLKKIFLIKKKYPVNIIEVPLLFEKYWEKYFDKSICVWANDEKQKEYLKKKNWHFEEFHKREKFQISKAEKLEKADFAIINHFSKEILKKQCQEIVYKTFFEDQ